MTARNQIFTPTTEVCTIRTIYAILRYQINNEKKTCIFKKVAVLSVN